jgi:endonuclease G
LAKHKEGFTMAYRKTRMNSGSGAPRRGSFKPKAAIAAFLVGAAAITGFLVHERGGLGDKPTQPVSPPAAQWQDSGPATAYTVGGYPVYYHSAGLPDAGSLQVLENTGYAAGFSGRLEDPLWSAYHCGAAKKFESGKRQARFIADPRVPDAVRLTHDDYTRPKGGKGYDRGHMAPNYAIATRYGDTAQKETFYMTNIIPQEAHLNQQTWQYIEAAIAGHYAPAKDGVWVVVGPVFGTAPQRYNGKAAIPEACYCILLDRKPDGSYSALALILDQSVSGPHQVGEFVTSIDEIERQTGLDFFSGLPDEVEKALEAAKAGPEWEPAYELKPGGFAE